MKDLDVLCAGLAVVNFPVSPVDSGIFERDISPVAPIGLLPGGDAANQAIVLSKLGFRVALASRRGDDPLGEALSRMLREHRIDLDQLAVDREQATSVCAVMIKPDGQRNFCVHKGAINRFCLGDIDLSALSHAKVASIGGMFGLPSFDGKPSACFFKAAKESGALTVADTKSDLCGIGLKGIRETLAYTDYFFPSYDEAAAVSGLRDVPGIARVFLDAGAEHVGIKLGAKGCYFRDRLEEFYLPAMPANVVDTTGAGDNFMAGFIAGLLQGWDAYRCCLLGTATSAVCVSQVGANSAVQNMGQVQNVMNNMVECDSCV